MKKNRHFLSVFITLMIILLVVPTANAATYKYPVDGGNLHFDPTTGTITDCDTTVYNAVIPSEIYGVPVTTIGKYAFSSCRKLTSVTIPNTVTKIGGDAFRSCSALKSINIPNSVTIIEKSTYGTFDECALETITIPGSVKKLDNFLFVRCKNLRSVTLKNGIEKLLSNSFYSCPSLEEIIVPDSVKKIDRSAFRECSNLKTVTIGSGVSYIDSNAFSVCNNLEAIYFRGNAPGTDGSIVSKFAPGFTIYYPEGASGWTTPTWNGFVSKPYKLTTSGTTTPAPQPTQEPTQQPTPQPSLPNGAATATPTASTVQVNGQTVAFDAYNINGNNFFKLRDLAFVLSGSQAQFEVSWDQNANAIRMTSGKSYTPVGGEMVAGGKINQIATPTASKVLINGKTVSFTAYTINGNNYFKLRDIGQAFDFGVDWDGAKNMILINTNKSYSPDPSTPSA